MLNAYELLLSSRVYEIIGVLPVVNGAQSI